MLKPNTTYKVIDNDVHVDFRNCIFKVIKCFDQAGIFHDFVCQIIILKKCPESTLIVNKEYFDVKFSKKELMKLRRVKNNNLPDWF